MNASKRYEFRAGYFPNSPIIHVKIGCLLLKIIPDRFFFKVCLLNSSLNEMLNLNFEVKF